jgi:hypothetical protein
MARPALRGILDGSLIRTGVMMVRRVILGVLVSAAVAAALVAAAGASSLQAQVLGQLSEGVPEGRDATRGKRPDRLGPQWQGDDRHAG